MNARARDVASDGGGGVPERRTLLEKVYDLLRRDILAGVRAPGEKLRIESLKRDYGYGATPLREALTRLTGELLVTFEGQRGFRVAPVSADDFADLCAVRRTIEIEAMRASILAADDAWETRVIEAHRRLAAIEKQLPDLDEERYEAWEVANRDFHTALLSNCPSRWLHHTYGILFHQAERYRRITYASVRKIARDVRREHALIRDAAVARDVDAACGLAASHIVKTLRVYERIERERNAAQDDAGR